MSGAMIIPPFPTLFPDRRPTARARSSTHLVVPYLSTSSVNNASSSAVHCPFQLHTTVHLEHVLVLVLVERPSVRSEDRPISPPTRPPRVPPRVRRHPPRPWLAAPPRTRSRSRPLARARRNQSFLHTCVRSRSSVIRARSLARGCSFLRSFEFLTVPSRPIVQTSVRRVATSEVIPRARANAPSVERVLLVHERLEVKIEIILERHARARTRRDVASSSRVAWMRRDRSKLIVEPIDDDARVTVVDARRSRYRRAVRATDYFLTRSPPPRSRARRRLERPRGRRWRHSKADVSSSPTTDRADPTRGCDRAGAIVRPFLTRNAYLKAAKNPRAGGKSDRPRFSPAARVENVEKRTSTHLRRRFVCLGHSDGHCVLHGLKYFNTRQKMREWRYSQSTPIVSNTNR